MKFLILFSLLCTGIALADEKSDILKTPAKTKEIWKPIDHDNTVYFEAKASPGFLRFDGQGAKVEGEIIVDMGKASGKLRIKMAELKTKSMVPGDSLRDEHMRTFFAVDKFPEAVLEFDPVLPRGAPFSWTGKLTIKGETKPIIGDAIINTQRENLQRVNATFKINLADYPSVGKISHAGVTVEDIINVKIDFLATNQK